MQTIHNAVYSMLRKSFQITKKKSQNSLENQFHDSIYENVKDAFVLLRIKSWK